MPSPIQAGLEAVHAAVSRLEGGEVADYIPELAKAVPDWFGIAIATTDGAVYEVGHSRVPFTIQSVSKPFAYGQAIADNGVEEVLRKVGVEPTGDAFNAIVIDQDTRRPFNPMVNAGAIVTTGLVAGADAEERNARIVASLGRFAGRTLSIDEAVYASERATGDRNRAIAYFMRNFSMVDDVESTLDVYFRQCSVLVTCRDLAVMAGTLAAGGRNPVTGARALERGHVGNVLSVMSTCGMYDFAGEWTYTVGLPAKSGVSGGVIAVLPGHLGIGVFAPRLDERGNSVRGIAACQELSRRFELHQFRPPATQPDVVKRRYRGDAVRSARQRTPEESAALDRLGRRVRVLELQGDLAFASTERLVRTVLAEPDGSQYLVVEGSRVGAVDGVAWDLLEDLARTIARRDGHLLLAGLQVNGHDLRAMADLDAALEWCEDDLLGQTSLPPAGVALADQELLAGLTGAQIAQLARAAEEVRLREGEIVFREGDAADSLYFVASGRVSVRVGLYGGRGRRVAAFGPGLPFGELSLLGEHRRTATVVADEPTVVHKLPFEALRTANGDGPAAEGVVAANLARLLAGRLRRATAQIRALSA